MARLGGRRRLMGDVAVLATIVVFALLANALHDSIASMSRMADGMAQAGRSIQTTGTATAKEIRTTLGSAANTAGQVPLVGGSLSATLREAADRQARSIERESSTAGRELEAAGRQGAQDTRDTAKLVGWLAFLMPTALLLAVVAPRRLTRSGAASAPAASSGAPWAGAGPAAPPGRS